MTISLLFEAPGGSHVRVLEVGQVAGKVERIGKTPTVYNLGGRQANKRVWRVPVAHNGQHKSVGIKVAVRRGVIAE